MIVDYKTASFTQVQAKLLPMYRVQLNAYAYIGERCGFSPVADLDLVFFQPVTDERAINEDTNVTTDGFQMAFSTRVLPVTIDEEQIPPLLGQVREIYDLDQPPIGKSNCQDCIALDALISATAIS